jgi:hypothetical protein
MGKHQMPNTKLQKPLKPQGSKLRFPDIGRGGQIKTRVALFEIWDLEILWCLVFGVWFFRPQPA